jgi:hypothetical protein
MKYEEVEIESMGVTQKHIIIDNEDGSFKSFPADESNPEYIAFLKKLDNLQEPTKKRVR